MIFGLRYRGAESLRPPVVLWQIRHVAFPLVAEGLLVFRAEAQLTDGSAGERSHLLPPLASSTSDPDTASRACRQLSSLPERVPRDPTSTRAASPGSNQFPAPVCQAGCDRPWPRRALVMSMSAENSMTSEEQPRKKRARLACQVCKVRSVFTDESTRGR